MRDGYSGARAKPANPESLIINAAAYGFRVRTPFPFGLWRASRNDSQSPSIFFALPPASAARVVSSKPATELMWPIGSYSSMSNG